MEKNGAQYDMKLHPPVPDARPWLASLLGLRAPAYARGGALRWAIMFARGGVPARGGLLDGPTRP